MDGSIEIYDACGICSPRIMCFVMICENIGLCETALFTSTITKAQELDDVTRSDLPNRPATVNRWRKS